MTCVGVVLAQCIWSGWGADPEVARLCAAPGAVEMFEAKAGQSATPGGQRSPLVTEAETFARYLNPPASQAKPNRPTVSPSNRPTVLPPSESVKFKLQGTSLDPAEPSRSMALIWEPGQDSGRWVKVGQRVGRFEIQQIRRGRIVYSDGEQLRQLSVEQGGSSGSPLVRNVRPDVGPVTRASDPEAKVQVMAEAQ